MSDLYLIAAVLWKILMFQKIALALFVAGILVWAVLVVLKEGRYRDEQEARYQWELRKAREKWAKDKEAE